MVKEEEEEPVVVVVLVDSLSVSMHLTFGEQDTTKHGSSRRHR